MSEPQFCANDGTCSCAKFHADPSNCERRAERLASELATLRPATAARLHLIECLVDHYGSVNRAVLMDAGGLGPAQVSRDLALYQRLAPGNLVFDERTKTYLKSTAFARLWP